MPRSALFFRRSSTEFPSTRLRAGGSHFALKQMTAARRAIRKSKHDMHMQAGSAVVADRDVTYRAQHLALFVNGDLPVVALGREIETSRLSRSRRHRSPSGTPPIFRIVCEPRQRRKRFLSGVENTTWILRSAGRKRACFSFSLSRLGPHARRWWQPAVFQHRSEKPPLCRCRAAVKPRAGCWSLLGKNAGPDQSGSSGNRSLPGRKVHECLRHPAAEKMQQNGPSLGEQAEAVEVVSRGS